VTASIFLTCGPQDVQFTCPGQIFLDTMQLLQKRGRYEKKIEKGALRLPYLPRSAVAEPATSSSFNSFTCGIALQDGLLPLSLLRPRTQPPSTTLPSSSRLTSFLIYVYIQGRCLLRSRPRISLDSASRASFQVIPSHRISRSSFSDCRPPLTYCQP